MLLKHEPCRARSAEAPLLSIGTSVAVLVACGDEPPGVRDRRASAALRALTGDTQIEIARRPSGRPRLAPPHPELGVSLSHRDGLLLAGFSPRAAIGVDLEIGDPSADPARLARDHFARSEADAVTRLPAAAARDLFYRMWVAKEAALKATGRGIYDGADEPCFTLHLAALANDRGLIAVPASSRLPAVRLTVARVVRQGAAPLYCALAVLDT